MFHPFVGGMFLRVAPTEVAANNNLETADPTPLPPAPWAPWPVDENKTSKENSGYDTPEMA